MPITREPLSAIRKNTLLASLTQEAHERLLSDLKPVSLKLGEVLYESGEVQKALYFPTTAIASLLYMTSAGQTAEIAVTGYEGVVGIAMFLGGGSMPSRAVVQSAGYALRMKPSDMMAEFERGGSFHQAMLYYTMALFTQMSVTAVCNRLHSVDCQFCRWLLISHDRLQTDTIVMTHELIASMLAVRRERVTRAAGRLQKAGLIHYRRGRITILDRAGLEAHVCECYRIIRNEHDRLLGKH